MNKRMFEMTTESNSIPGIYLPVCTQRTKLHQWNQVKLWLVWFESLLLWLFDISWFLVLYLKKNKKKQKKNKMNFFKNCNDPHQSSECVIYSGQHSKMWNLPWRIEFGLKIHPAIHFHYSLIWTKRNISIQVGQNVCIKRAINLWTWIITRKTPSQHLPHIMYLTSTWKPKKL